MSNLNQNTVDLQAILDAVNTLPESTDLTPIVEALTEKGQTVPDGATVDVLASLIAAIEAGGGGGINSGEITIAEDCDQLTIVHGFEAIPSIFMIMLDHVSANAGTNYHVFCCTYDTKRTTNWYFIAGYSSSNTSKTLFMKSKQGVPSSATGAGYYGYPPNQTEILLNKGDSAGFKAGGRYVWLAKE